MDRIDLKQWTVFFVKNRDVFEKKLVSYEEKGNQLCFKFKDKEVIYLISEQLDGAAVAFAKEPGFRAIVCLASAKNLDFIVDHWKDFSPAKDLTLILADMETNKRMLVKPYVHSIVSDDATLKLGLQTLFENTFLGGQH